MERRGPLERVKAGLSWGVEHAGRGGKIFDAPRTPFNKGILRPLPPVPVADVSLAPLGAICVTFSMGKN